jgi:hypothetical protein
MAVMKDLSIYFNPVETHFCNTHPENLSSSINKYVTTFPEIESGSIALMFVPEFRNLDHTLYLEDQPNQIREELYNLFPKKHWHTKIYDLGTILPGSTVKDTFYALEQVISELVKFGIIPIIIGGSQDLTLAQFDAYKNLEQLVNLVSIDSMPDFGEEDELAPNNYLQHILKRKPNHLFNFSILGTQLYLVNPHELELIQNLYFDVCRLGEIQADLSKSEPYIRNADLVSFDLLSIRQSDYPRDIFTSPNGFYAEEICQLARYAGLSDKLSSLGFYNFFELEQNQANFKLMAQIIWHAIDGINNRFNDYPKTTKSEYLKYRVVLSEFKDEIIFYKSPKSERWWIEVPYHPTKGSKYERHMMVPCSYDDYKTALEDEVPNLWWQTYQKIFI